MFDIQNLRNNINVNLEEHHMTINQLSEQADIPINTLKTLLYGTPRDCYITNVAKIAKVFNLSIDELTGIQNLNPELLQIMQYSRHIPNHIIHYMQWVAKLHYELNKKQPTHRIIHVQRPLGQNDLLVLNSDSYALNISHLSDDIRPKIYMGIEMPTDLFMPIYGTGDVLLLSKLPEPQKRVVVTTGYNLWILDEKNDGFYSIVSKEKRFGHETPHHIIGYVVDVIKK